MKKTIVAILAICACSIASQAQTYTVKPNERLLLRDTLRNADTSFLSFNSIANGLKSVQVAVKQVSGTVAGSVIIQGTVDGENWVPAGDTLTLSNQSVNTKTWIFTATNYNSYRTRFISSGTVVAAISAALLRRQTE